MDTSKLSRYDWVVVAGMILMFIALFLTWYRVEIVQRLLQELSAALNGAGVDTSGFSVNGWHYFSAVLAWLLTVVATAVVIAQGAAGRLVPAAAAREPHGHGPRRDRLPCWCCIASSRCRRRQRPSADGAGIFVALLATFVVAAGGFLKNAEPR